MAKTYSPKPKGIQDQFRSECTKLLQPIKEDGDEVCNDDDDDEEAVDESDNIGDGNHLHAIDVAAREEGNGGNGDAPTQEDKNLVIARCYNSYNQ